MAEGPLEAANHPPGLMASPPPAAVIQFAGFTIGRAAERGQSAPSSTVGGHRLGWMSLGWMSPAELATPLAHQIGHQQ